MEEVDLRGSNGSLTPEASGGYEFIYQQGSELLELYGKKLVCPVDGSSDKFVLLMVAGHNHPHVLCTQCNNTYSQINCIASAKTARVTRV